MFQYLLKFQKALVFSSKLYILSYEVLIGHWQKAYIDDKPGNSRGGGGGVCVHIFLVNSLEI